MITKEFRNVMPNIIGTSFLRNFWSYKYNNDSNDKIKSSNTFVVSDVSDGIVTLVSNCLHVLDFPLSLLPFDVQKGQILQLDISRAVDVEKSRVESFKSLQNDLLVASMSR